MIALRRVTLLTPDRRGHILDRQDLVIGDRDRVGVLAPAGSGRSSIARLLCGVDTPHSGEVLSAGRVSWPLGYAGFLHPDLTVRRNVEHLSDLTGLPLDPALRIACWLCGDMGIPERRVSALTPGQRGLVAEACGFGFPADHYVADEKLLFGDEGAQARGAALLRRRLTGAGLILLSRNPNTIEQWCTRIFALVRARLVPCDSVNMARSVLERAGAENARGGKTHEHP